MSPEERAARDGRDRSKALPGSLIASWESWSRELAEEGLRLIRTARRSRKPDEAAKKRDQGIKLLEAAEKFALRAHRNGPNEPGPPTEPAGLDAFRRQRDA